MIAAEGKRVADGTTFAMAGPLAQAARAVGQDRSIALPFTPDVVPAPSGMLLAEEPLMSIGPNPMAAVTWGLPWKASAPACI
ncbi:hypothetical protein [Streptomyces lydicus]|uniref:hypothetical protein n=1 Tax=Streptomyces lydicus TaxID=47763 RepID=UPI003797FDA3